MPDPYITKAEEICPKKKEYSGLNDCYNQALSDCLPIVAELLKRVDELEEINKGHLYLYGKLLAKSDRHKEALAEIENNHFECDAGEACKAHNIAKRALEEK